jgi:hypothetical protein
MFKSPLKRVLDVIQLSEFGDIDPEIYFEFEPLYEMSEKERADIRKVDAETDAVYATQIQALSANEIREKIADDPDSPYHSLDLSDEIEIEEGDYDDDEGVAAENDKGGKA